MTNNDVLRRLRYTFDFGDSKMMEIFSLAGFDAGRPQVCAWLKPEDDPEFTECSDAFLAAFLNGLIIEKRGAKEGARPEPETVLTNNIIFRKLKIALDLKADDTLEILERGGMPLSKHELSAFFRKPGNRHFRACKDQVLRKFLKGIQMTYRPDVWGAAKE